MTFGCGCVTQLPLSAWPAAGMYDPPSFTPGDSSGGVIVSSPVVPIAVYRTGPGAGSPAFRVFRNADPHAMSRHACCVTMHNGFFPSPIVPCCTPARLTYWSMTLSRPLYLMA